MDTRNRPTIFFLSLGLMLVVGGGCPGDGDTEDDDTGDDDTGDDDTGDDDAEDDDSSETAVTFSKDVLPLTYGCTCHTNGQFPADLDLSTAVAYQNLVNIPSTLYPSMDRVKPGDPTNSFFLLKLSQSVPPVGNQMPPTGPYLSPSEIATIDQWIAEGAQDN